MKVFNIRLNLNRLPDKIIGQSIVVFDDRTASHIASHMVERTRLSNRIGVNSLHNNWTVLLCIETGTLVKITAWTLLL